MLPQSTPQGVLPGSIPLFAGHPAHELLPSDGVRRAIDSLWQAPGLERLFNYGDERGNPALIDYLVGRLGRSEALELKRENLMIIGGSTWGVDMICSGLTRAGDVALVDAPSYRDALHIFRDHHLHLIDLPIDAGGVIVDAMEETLRELEKRGRLPRFYYVVPNFQNPTGITMPEARRQQVIALSQRYGFVIVEDDVYSDIRFTSQLPASFYTLAGGENVLRLGTFSKTLAPGLRLGWLLGHEAAIARFVNSGLLAMGGGANPFTAAIVARYCQSGDWERHLAWLRGQYRDRRDIALRALGSSMPDTVSYTKPEGGYFIWLTLPASLRVDELAEHARQENVYFAPGTGFFVNPQHGSRYLRLSFSFVPVDELRAGIEILGALIQRLGA